MKAIPYLLMAGAMALAMQARGLAMEAGMEITSAAFAAGGWIPAKYTCEGADISPPLAWRNVPEGTRALALIVDDPDAPDPAAPRMIWTHWVVTNIPPQASGLAEGASMRAMPQGAVEGINGWHRQGYGGPCPPIGAHRYFFKLYALDAPLPHEPLTKPALLEAMEGHVLAKAELVGIYEKGR